MVRFIDKDGNRQEFNGSQTQEDNFTNGLVFNSGVYFEPREDFVDSSDEVMEEETKDSEEETELDRYKSILKEAKVKWRQLISDVDRARAKCEENGLI